MNFIAYFKSGICQSFTVDDESLMVDLQSMAESIGGPLSKVEFL